MADSDSIKLCECGCGLPAPIATCTYKRHGHVRGQPMRFRRGHGNAKHRLSNNRTFRSWSRMLDRCYNNRSDKWRHYGGRGIFVCQRWRDSFENFLADMGERPPNMSLDRIDNNGNYEPYNCRWATQKQQTGNRRCVTLLSLNGESMHLTDWSKRTGISRRVLWSRLYRYGWSVERALCQPLRQRLS